MRKLEGTICCIITYLGDKSTYISSAYSTGPTPESAERSQGSKVRSVRDRKHVEIVGKKLEMLSEASSSSEFRSLGRKRFGWGWSL